MYVCIYNNVCLNLGGSTQIHLKSSHGFMGKKQHCINSASSNSKTEVTLAMLHGVWLWKFITKLDDPGKTDKRHYYCACAHTGCTHQSTGSTC